MAQHDSCPLRPAQPHFESKAVPIGKLRRDNPKIGWRTFADWSRKED
jgi:hypothetical protein